MITHRVNRTGLGALSLRARLVVAVALVLAVVLILLAVAARVIFAVQARHTAEQLLVARIQLARQLANNDVKPQQLINRVEAGGAVATLTLADGRSFGTATPHGWLTRTVTLTAPAPYQHASLTVAVQREPATATSRLLTRVLVVVGLGALLLGVLLALLAVRLAVRPLDQMAATAAAIGAGERGRRLRPVRTDTELGRTATAIDTMLDELEGAEARSKAAEADARQAAARMQDLLADVAHELRTPMAGVQAAAEALLHAPDDLAAADREHLEVLLVTEARRASALVEDLLDVARIDAGVRLSPEPVSLRGLVASEIDRLAVLRPGIRLTVTGPDPDLVADRRRIAQILRNLIDNAVRAVEPNGTITIMIALSTVGDGVIVDVLDSGPGVPAMDRERIFGRLVRGDRHRSRGASSGGGAGLGLAIARGLAQAHGGTLVCLDPAVAGATGGALFRLTLPLRPVPAR